MVPFSDTAKRFIPESELMVTRDERILRKSHTLTVRSSEPDTTLSSLVLVNTVQVTVLLYKYLLD